MSKKKETVTFSITVEQGSDTHILLNQIAFTIATLELNVFCNEETKIVKNDARNIDDE